MCTCVLETLQEPLWTEDAVALLWHSAWPLLTMSILIHQMSQTCGKCSAEQEHSELHRGESCEDLCRRQSLEALLDTHWTIMNSHQVNKWYRQPTCQVGHMEKKSQGTISYFSGNRVKWDGFAIGVSMPAIHM